jgi:pimeloyl-ACP methyl ester carboxylesterase
MIKTSLCLPLYALALSVSPTALAQSAPNDAQRPFAQPQQMVDIGGRRLNLYCSGDGPVTVVFDSPTRDSAWTWFEVQPEVAKRTRACVYDRAGLGFSDPSPRTPTSGNLVDDLHQLLKNAAIAPPYVMVGTSFGGANVQLYAYRYPEQVAGLVLVEPHHEDETERMNKASQGKLKQMYAMFAENDKACAAQAERGFVPGSALWANCIGPTFPRHGRALAAARLAQYRTPGHWRAALAEEDQFDASGAELRSVRKPYGDLPLIVLSRGVSPFAVPGKPQSALNKATEAENLAMHKEIAALSTRGKHRVVPGTGHIVHLDKPEAVVAAIGEMLNEVKR